MKFGIWLGNIGLGNLKPDTESRAGDAWRRINDKPTTLVLRRDGVFQTAQTVRVEVGGGNYIANSPEEVSTLARRAVTVFGVRGHVDATVVDTDIIAGDQFGIDGDSYTVVDVALFPGEIQATAYRDS